MRRLAICLLVVSAAVSNVDANRALKRQGGNVAGSPLRGQATGATHSLTAPRDTPTGRGGPELVVKSPARLAIEAKGLTPNRVDRLAEKLTAWGAARPKRKVAIKLADRLAYLFGVETMDTASVELTGSLSLSIPGFKWLGNANAWLRHWVPSKHYKRLKAEQGWDEKLTGVGGGIGTALGDFGWDSIEGLMVPYVSERSFDLSLGVPNLLQFALGDMRASSPTEYARGPYIGMSVELFPLSPTLSVAGDLYIHYRPLEKLVERVRPFAARMQNFLQRLRRWVTGPFGGKQPAQDPVSAASPSETATWRAIGSHWASDGIA